MKIVIVGGGPAGLYLAILLRMAKPDTDITLLERNPRGATYGWGVVFSDQTLENFRAADEKTYGAIVDNFAHWDDIDVHFRGRTITSTGHGFSGISRQKLLEILQRRAAKLGTKLRFECDVADLSELEGLGLGDADLIVAADGANSVIRTHEKEFGTNLDVRLAKFVWLGTTKPFGAFTFAIIENELGIFQAHAYRFDKTFSTFIVECDEASWCNAGFERMGKEETLRYCEDMFGEWLDGHELITNATHLEGVGWRNFVRVSNEHWFHDNIVLLGDAAHTAHFSIGSGTKLAMEDSIVLARTLSEEPDVHAALSAYQDERRLEALRLQNAARNSMEWFENVKRYVSLDPVQFTYSLLTRSQRVSHENLRLRDRRYLEGVERWFASKPESREVSKTIPPMFTPYKLRGLELPNRVVVAPMDMYSAVDGVPNEFHLVHLGARALGGASMVFTEMTCVTPEGRITPGCTGMYRDDHVAAWRRITEFVHTWTPTKICFQIGHAGRKGSTKVPWEGTDVPLDEGNWKTLGPSPIPWNSLLPPPREMTRADMDDVIEAFVRATRMAIDANFDMLELHCAHGYLLSSFITLVSNRRTDEYGGSLENRLRFPLQVFRAVREAWPEERPMSVRISATDWVEDGIQGPEAVRVAQAFYGAGADIIHVSAGQTTIEAKPVYGRMFQTPFSDRIRNEMGIPTIAVGNITEADQVNVIIAAGRADMCALARPHLSDPHWTLRAAAELNYEDMLWPVQYESGKDQLSRHLRRRADMLAAATAGPLLNGRPASATARETELIGSATI